ncbi:hypothetical protein FA13DRAFT_1717462 [Coprinellus micaceus]|uniref:Uncharacterized protein n=1 Tax=Coprinellus micaceus TaxID=71717 RepID=A0A4Y7SGH7_COPMI|nr:hypothetical protein FA13DRAFT_1717462 [Coprinellus micaceus]
MASPPFRLDSLDAQQWTTCYHYCAAWLYFALTAWNKYVRGVYDRSQEIRPAVFHKFQQAILKEVRFKAWASTVGTVVRSHGMVLEYGQQQGRLVAEVTNIVLDRERVAHPTDLRTFLDRWAHGAAGRSTTLLPWWDSLPWVDVDETFTSLSNLVETFDVEMTLAPLPAPDAEWIIRSNMPEEQQRVEQLQLARFLARQTVAVTAKRLLAVKARMKTLAGEIERRGGSLPLPEEARESDKDEWESDGSGSAMSED